MRDKNANLKKVTKKTKPPKPCGIGESQTITGGISVKIGAAYIRVSTDMQVELSPESQLKAIKEYAKNHDIILSNEFIFQDEGISGRKAEKRPGFMNMIAVAKSKPKPFDVILIWKFSRFARNREDSIVYKSMLRKQCGIEVISISEQLGEDKTSILIEALLEAMDEYYSINLAEEVKRGMSEKVARGGVVSAPPIGYIMGDDKFIPDPERADIIRQVFSRFLEGERSFTIAKWLNSMGITTRNGKTFAKRTVDYILTNPVYTGKHRWNPEGSATSTSVYKTTDKTIIVDGNHEALVSQEDFDKVQEILAEIKKKYPKYISQAPTDYMLKGLIKCHTCGASLTMSTVKCQNSIGLQCVGYVHAKCNVSHYISLKKINAAVIDGLKADMSLPTFIIKRTLPKQDTDVEYLKSQLKKETAKIDRIKAAFENGIDSIEEYKENKARINQSIEAIEAQLAQSDTPKEISVDIRSQISEAYAVATDSTLSEDLKNSFLRDLIDKIVFDSTTKGIEIFYK